jgi:hypothetical protein
LRYKKKKKKNPVGGKTGGVGGGVPPFSVLSRFDGIGGRPVCAMTDARLMGRERSIIIDYPLVRASCIVHTRFDLSRDFFVVAVVVLSRVLSILFFYFIRAIRME